MVSISDHLPNAVRFGIGTDYNAGSWNRTILSTSQEQLLHIKIEMQICSDYTDFLFSDIPNVSSITLYTTTATEDPMNSFNAFDNVDYIQPISYPLCPPPLITNFFPTTISSGTNSVLTIQGYGFGNSRSTGQIWLKNDKNASAYIEHFDNIDYVSWTDTEIKFIVPSTVDTLSVGKGVGTGYISVKRDDGAAGWSTTPLEVSYANMNVSISKNTPNYKKIPLRMIASDLDTAKYFYLDTSITSFPDKEIAIREALHYWSCATLVNWYVKSDTTLQNAEDDISVIHLDDSFHGEPIAKTRFSRGSTCTDDNGNLIAYYKDIDIGFSRDFNNIASTNWFVDTSYTLNTPANEEDFYAVTQHELGHAHSLNHVNDNDDIMFAHSKRGFVNYIDRADLYASPNAISGGDYVMLRSEEISSCNGISLMIPSSAFNCETGIGFDELFNNYTNLVAYPNPLDDILNLKFELERNAIVDISIYDYMGKEIKHINFGKQHIGVHNLQINVNDVSSGLYFIRVQFNNRNITTKLVKY